jgi:hypothetical protein
MNEQTVTIDGVRLGSYVPGRRDPAAAGAALAEAVLRLLRDIEVQVISG